ncbi:MAG: electron transport complex protein RnfA [Bacteroidales bacterium]|jgi:electron transport complex protein RnfA|nr:electron transport complex protein RnfA [Bacteroidales bacterium]
MDYLIIIIAAIFVNNIVLAQFLGICPFLGVSGKVKTAIGMGGAVLFVMTLATVVTWLIMNYILVKFNIVFMQTIAYILVIAALVQMVEIILKKISPSLYQALGVFLPLITTNCTILGVAIIVIQKEYDLMHSVVFAIGTALGFMLALIIFAGIREHMEKLPLPKGMKGVPSALVVAGILALAFMGFAGLV